MSAADTALRVLLWTMRPDAAALPEGRLRHPLDLADPGPDTASLTATLAARTAARLRLDRLAAAERRPVGVGAVLTAAAVGGRAEPADRKSVV